MPHWPQRVSPASYGLYPRGPATVFPISAENPFTHSHNILNTLHNQEFFCLYENNDVLSSCWKWGKRMFSMFDPYSLLPLSLLGSGWYDAIKEVLACYNLKSYSYL